jgi:hypothetical protein
VAVAPSTAIKFDLIGFYTLLLPHPSLFSASEENPKSEDATMVFALPARLQHDRIANSAGFCIPGRRKLAHASWTIRRQQTFFRFHTKQ